MNDNSCISPLRCMSDLPLAIFSGNMTVNWSSLHFPLSNIKGTYIKTFHFPYPKKWDPKKLSSTIFFAHLSFPAFLWLSGGLINRGSNHSLKLAVYLNMSLAKSSAWESLLSFNIVQPCVVICTFSRFLFMLRLCICVCVCVCHCQMIPVKCGIAPQLRVCVLSKFSKTGSCLCFVEPLQSRVHARRKYGHSCCCCNVWSHLSTMFCQPLCLSTQICPHLVTCQHNMFNVNRIVFCRFFLERIDQWVMSVPLQQQSPKWLGQTHSTPSGGCQQRERGRELQLLAV